MTAPLFVTGATGYVGGRLVKALEELGLRVLCLARRPEHLRGRVSPSTEIIPGDLLAPEGLAEAMRKCRTAYYLVHSLSEKENFEAAERQTAEHFARAAQEAGVERIVYLGGLAPPGKILSPHMRSRRDVGDVLRSTGVPVLEFRASIVIGAGSLSFEMIRALVERLPVMITPRWVSVPAQPISITDVVEYLAAAPNLPLPESRVVEIGGTSVTSYRGLMEAYARRRGLRRWMVSVPVLTPGLSALWLGLVTPLFARVGRHLIESIRYASVVNDPSARELFPAIRPMGMEEALAAAMEEEERRFAATRWSDSLASGGGLRSWAGVRFGTRLADHREKVVSAPAHAAFAPIRRIGGRRGWYYANALWTLRGWADLLAGGVGMRRGRRDPERLLPGDVVDCWRVEAIEPDRRLRLKAEMRLPGRAWLEFEIVPEDDHCRLRQTAVFDPLGLAGQFYWAALYPAHQIIFAGMLNAIAREAERGSS
jgi:uncharacterized protein YbjT (DUF2867 family)